MAITARDIPEDSILHAWVSYLSATEVPFSYQLAGGLSAIGVLCRRQRWIDQLDWRVYPNQSVMFIGPSGIGKDTIINRCQRMVEALHGQSRVPVIGGVTMESIHARLLDLPLAAAYIPAPEITAFFGKADYQANLLTGVTNLLSNGQQIDVSTRGGLREGGGRPQLIKQPTITMHTGSTVEWLHRGMPQGTLEGGFLGRFLIVIEEIGTRFVPLVKRDRTKEQLLRLKRDMDAWMEGCQLILKLLSKPHEMIIYTEAEDRYTNWYYNRFKLFSRAVMPYANRSRDTVLRLAMLIALSRMHDRWIEDEDMALAIQLMSEVASRIDAVVLPPTPEAQAAMQILQLLPCTIGKIYEQLGTRYKIRTELDPAFTLLRSSNKIHIGRDSVVRLATPAEETDE